MITREEVKHIAKLARLGLTEKEIDKYQEELGKILDYINKLKEADVSAIELLSRPLLPENVTRKDESLTDKNSLLDLAPETKKGYLKTKSILSK